MQQDIEIDINDPQNKPKKVNIHERVTQCPISADEMDTRRKYQKEYDYLCYMAQARDWISRLISVQIENNLEFKQMIRKGEIFVKLASVLLNKKINIYENPELVYRHTDNHNLFLDALRSLKVRECYLYVTIDAYNEYNVPSIIYCIHALSNHCEKLGFDLKIEKDKQYHFSETEFSSVKKDIDKFSQFDFEKIGVEDDFAPSDFFDSEENMKKVLSDLIQMKLKDIKYKVQYNDVKGAVKAKLVKMGTGTLPPLSHYLTQRVKEKVHSVFGTEHSDALKKILRSFLRRNTMKEIFTGNASLFSIREVVKRQPIGLKYMIECKHELIENGMKENTEIENEVDRILSAIDLIIENKRIFSGIETDSSPLENNKRFGQIFNMMRSNPKIILDVLSKVDPHELEDFIPRYIVPLFSVSSSRDQFLVLQIIDTDFSEFGASLYADETEQDEIHYLSFKIIADLFKASEEAKKICGELLIRETVKISTVKEEYRKSLDLIKEIVERTITNLQNVQFPHYVVYFFACRNEKSDLYHFYTDFISPFIAAPDAFFKRPNFKVNRNSLLTIDSVFQGVLKGKFSNDYYRPLQAWAENARQKMMNVFEEIKFKSNTGISYGLFRIQRPFIIFQYKNLNQFLEKIKIFTTCSPEFNELLKYSEPYNYFNNEPVKFYLNSIICENSHSEIDDIIDIIRVSNGKELSGILNRRSTPEEELKYKKLVNFRNMTRKKYLTENIDENDDDFINTPFSINDDFESTTDTNFSEDSVDKIDINDRRNHLDNLKNKLSIREITPDILFKICERVEETQILVSQKRNELKINTKTLLNLKKKNSYLQIQKKSYTDYYQSILESYFKQSGGNCSKKSLFGTFKYSQRSLLKKNVLYNPKENENIQFFFACDRPGVINISSYDGSVLIETYDVLFENILKSKNTRDLKIGSTIFNPKGILRIVNECYLH